MPSLICGFWLQISVFRYRIISLYVSQTSPVTLCMQNIVISTRIASLCGSQTSPVVLCVENSDFRTKIACLYGSKTSPVILCRQNSVPSFRITSLYESQPSSVVFGCKTATLGPDLQVSIGPSPHLWFLHTKQRLLDPNSKSLWVPDITCRFVPAIQRD